MKNILIIIFLTLLSSLGFSETKSKPYFSLTQMEKQTLLDKANTIKIGSSYESVLSIMGKPNHDGIMMAKESEEVIGRSVKYYAVIWEKGLVNELHDEHISIYFDPTDHVKNIDIKIFMNEK